jgi:hypothetical protein
MKGFTKISVISIIVAAMVCSTCANGTVGTDNVSKYRLRYDAHPVWVEKGENTIEIQSAAQTTRAAQKIDAQYMSVISAEYNPLAGDAGENEFYVYLGYVDNVPMVVGDAGDYDGITPVTVSFVTSQTDSATIRASVETCTKETVYKGTTNTTTTGAKVGFTYAGFSAGANVENVKRSEDSTTTENTIKELNEKILTKIDTKSTTVTYENIGSHGEPKGRYRVSLFATTDVYYYVKLNGNNTELLEEEYIYFSREDSHTIALDYDPSTTGVFNKNSKSDPLPVPALEDFISLSPSLYFRKYITTPVAIKDTVGVNGSNYLFSTTTHIDAISTGFNIDKLRDEGYKSFKIEVSYQRTIPAKVSSVTLIQQTGYISTSIANAGSQILELKWGHGTGGLSWDSEEWIYDARAYESGVWISYSLTMPINDYSNQFSLLWSGKKSTVMGGHEWTLEERNIMVTPLKEE